MDARLWCLGVAVGMAASTPALAQTPNIRSEPEIKRTVVEDDKVRIEELRVRGQVQRITVSPKASGVRPYEIVPPDAGRDASQNKGLSGQRLWQLFSF
ncbi:MAG: hypothetical protein KIT60_19365 [Burkholderiaceae bacterium]|jgi:hypothetical protein|nr:hypothetical protein [Burkholderiaceae bacterium]